MTNFANMVEGYRRFRAGDWSRQRERWEELKDGQSPGVMVIACSDSRVDPTQIFDTNPGETFVVRNVAALVPPFETSPGHHGVSAALEFAVQVLGVSEILVMGHGFCGGCKAALSAELKNASFGEGGHIAGWISMLEPARERVISAHGHAEGNAPERMMEQEGVKISLQNLRTFPYIKEKEAAGQLNLIGAIFSISDGVLNVLDETSGKFAPVA